jgi:hypothetical protein
MDTAITKGAPDGCGPAMSLQASAMPSLPLWGEACALPCMAVGAPAETQQQAAGCFVLGVGAVLWRAAAAAALQEQCRTYWAVRRQEEQQGQCVARRRPAAGYNVGAGVWLWLRGVCTRGANGTG